MSITATESDPPLKDRHLPDLIPIQMWSEYTGLSVPTLARQRADGTGAPFVRIGRSVRYKRDRALAWLDSLVEA